MGYKKEGVREIVLVCCERGGKGSEKGLMCCEGMSEGVVVAS